MLVPLRQQEPGVDAARYALEEEDLAMLNPLEDHPLVLQAPEEVGQLFVRGVEGQLGEGRDGVGGVPGLGDVEQRQRRRERRGGVGGGEGQGASRLLLRNQRRGQIGEKPDLVSGGTWTQPERVDQDHLLHVLLTL